MQIAVIGTGYVGLVSGACFAEFGIHVTCVDVDAAKIEKLNNNIIPIYEPGLDDLVERNVKAGRLEFTTDLKSAVYEITGRILRGGHAPPEDGTPDMSYYQQAADDVAGAMNDYKVLVTKSTVTVGTGKWLWGFCDGERSRLEWNSAVASNPEFLREGAAIQDFMRPEPRSDRQATRNVR